MNRFPCSCSLFALLAATAPAQVVWLPVATTMQPAARRDARMAYDSVRDRVVLYGGYGSYSSLYDTWEWDGAQWLQRNPVNHPPGSRGAMAYHRGSQRVVFVGDSATQPVWIYDGVDWTPVATATQPPGSGEDALAADAARGVLVLQTQGIAAVAGQTWEYDGFGWQRRFPPASPPPVRNAGMVFDTSRNRTILHGGTLGATTQGATWEYDGTTWTQTPTTAGNPGTYAFAFAFDSHRRRAVLLGGYATSQFQGLREYDANGWQQRASLAPDGRAGAAIAYDAARQECVFFGGQDNFGFYNDTFRCRALSPALVVPFGQGCPANGVVPGLQPAAYHVPYVGMPFRVDLYALPYGQPALLAFGSSRTNWNGAPLPASLAPIGMPGCSLLVAPDGLVPATGSGAQASLTIAVPNQATLVGLPFYLQGFALAPGSNPANLVATRALDCRIGSP